MTGDREKDLLEAADMLLDARRTGNYIADLPEKLRPVDAAEIEFIQDAIARAFGDIGGYKIGAPNLQATPTFAPMPAVWISPGGSTLTGARWRYRVVEGEIAFLVGKDLPPRDTPYTREEVLDAMASCHPAIEILETGILDPAAASPNTPLADLQRNGGLVYGDAFPAWRTTDWNTEKVTLAVDGSVREERVGSNTSGDLLRLLPFLANEGAARTGGLRKGQWITTGSWTGNTPALTGSTCDLMFSTAGSVNLRFG
jgi:2-keto-4-pentenoate hydratase